MKIFLSYGHDVHKKLAERLVSDLNKKGYNVWIDVDKKCIQVGADWEGSIEDGIEGADWFIILMTEHSLRRPEGYCLDEVCYARMKNKKIIPLKIQEVAPPLSIVRIQWLDMKDYLAKSGAIDEVYYQQKLETIVSLLEGTKSLKLEGRHLSLINELAPLDNELYIAEYSYNFYGRKWLFEKYDQWLKDDKSRVFSLIGGAGSGKSAFISKLVDQRDEIKAVHFCRYNNSERADAKRAIMSIAYHLATQIAEYNDYLLDHVDLTDLKAKNITRLFEYLIIEPLNKITISKEQKIVIVIDALDEAEISDRNELINLIVNDFHKTPAWLKLVVTSRPEQDIARKLVHLSPVVFEQNESQNEQDIKGFLKRELTKNNYNISNIEEVVEKLFTKSENNFLYVVEIIKDINRGNLTIDNIDEFPKGLISIYQNYFERHFSLNKTYDYAIKIRPILEIICSSYEPIPISIIEEMLNLDEYELEEILEYIYVLFPNNTVTVEAIHKSLYDFLLNKSLSGHFRINLKTAHKRIAEFLEKKFENQETSNYLIKHFTRHLIFSSKISEAKKLLCNSDLQKKRISLLGQDSGIKAYLEDLSLIKTQVFDISDLLMSPLFKDIYANNRRYFYNEALYFDLKSLGFDEVFDEFLQIDNLEIKVATINYLYINEQYLKSITEALKIVEAYQDTNNFTQLAELENIISLAYRKIVDFDKCLTHAKKAINYAIKAKSLYEESIAQLTLGKVYYHRLNFKDGLIHLQKAIDLLVEITKTHTDPDYLRMITMYIGAFEREVALSLVWQGKTVEADKHLDNSKRMYDTRVTKDRYYIRFLYVGMINSALKGDFHNLDENYENMQEFAKSKYDKSQLEFYYSLALYFNHQPLYKVKKHLNNAFNYVKQLDSYLEYNEIVLFGEILKGNYLLETMEFINYDNKDIKAWLSHVYEFILKNKANKEYKLIIVDIDGTLITSNNILTTEVKDVINEMIDGGKYFSLSTGRPVIGIRSFYQDLKIKNMPMITYNGGHVSILNEEPILNEKLESNLAKEIIEMGRSITDITQLVWVDDVLYAEVNDPKLAKYQQISDVTPIVVGDLTKVTKQGVNKILWYGELETINQHMNAINQTFIGRINAKTSRPMFLEIVGNNVSKANALEILSEKYSISLSEIIAVGDGLNDLPMLKKAGLGIAVANAHKEVIDISNVVVPSNDLNGVAFAIKMFMKKKH